MMNFTPETWIKQAHQKLREIGRWLEEGDAPYLAYGTVAGLSLWPLVEAAAATPPGQSIPLSLGITLLSVAGNVGANLIAEQLQRWHDQAQSVTEPEVVTWIQEQVATTDDLRQALDQLLETFQAIPQGQNSLSEADKNWFAEKLRQELTHLGNLPRFRAYLVGGGAIVQGAGAKGVGERGVLIEGSVAGDVIPGQKINISGQDFTVVIGNDKEPLPLDRQTALGRYLTHVIAHNRYLQLQGVSSGGRMVHIKLEQIYITLRATQQRTVQAEERWLAEETRLAPGERHSRRGLQSVGEKVTETVTVSVNKALTQYRRLVVLGDPGSGKTTLLRYLALLYARDLSTHQAIVRRVLAVNEGDMLPILLPLRQIGAFLKTHGEESTEGHRLLLEFLQRHLQNERIDVPLNFFDAYLEQGQAVILLDGLDEVAGADLRRRVARLVERFTQAYPTCRYVVTSRIVGYSDASRLGEGYMTTTVRDFTLADVEQFLRYWHRLVAVGQMGPGDSAEHEAQRQTQQLMTAVRQNERIRELAINPLMLTVIALVHRDRVKLPDRRAELYAEAVEVLLGKWDEARGVVAEQSILPDRPFDTTDRRLFLQSLALHMHERQQKEIEAEALQDLLRQLFRPLVAEAQLVDKVVHRFLRLIEERTGLLVARGKGVYTFSHLTFQEYLVALAIAARDDYVSYTLSHSHEAWWREVIRLEVGHLSLTSKERTTRLVAALADHKPEPSPFHNLVLAAECLRDAGESRVAADVAQAIPRRLRAGLEVSPSRFARWLKGEKRATTEWIEQRSAAMSVLVRAGAGYWTMPNGEPEWVEIPAGKFMMGSETADEKPVHWVHVESYAIARVPVTNTQYHLFVTATGYSVPEHWQDGRPPKEVESHPVVNMSWRDALRYCQWLSQMTGKEIGLPTEAEWEKAARGDKDVRVYPWGDKFDRLRCNSSELGLGKTTPVGIFPDGASPYGVLDMSGNVWEWVQSKYAPYPYQPGVGRDRTDESNDARVLRGGSWLFYQANARAASRNLNFPNFRHSSFGFRVVCRPSSQDH